MTLSVVVPTYRRPADLKRCLAALRAQTRMPDEVLVIARPEDDATARRLAIELKSANRFALRVIDTGAGGQVVALNRGLDAAEGDIIAITDDDAAPHPDWIERIARAFDEDERLGAIGGRDWVHEKGRVLDGSRLEVGVVRRSGRVVGNHHLGVGPARDVRMLKGANMSYRRAAISTLRFDTRLRGAGAQVHNDMAFSMSVRRAGWRVLYDPLVAVDHFPAERFDDDRRDAQTPGALTDAAYNFHLILNEALEPFDREIAWLWYALIGTRVYPGVLHTLIAVRGGWQRAWDRWRAVRKGALQARRTSDPSTPTIPAARTL
ncbi:glycosyltransferase family A protein [Caballeronia sp. J97]|uniref:glycosyltransferase family 2 protein n=1 Tax=Caballeronia sp. J97 TaxID=2805429 RepID=UPI002AB222E7|nr:glycosyltransferase family A protein [Caballeronia sp. J97]